MNLWLILVTITLTILGCASPTAISPQGPSGSLALSIGTNNGRTLLPSISMNVASYTISGTGPSGTNFSQSTTSTVVSIPNLKLGSWTVLVQALNATSDVIASGQAAATVTSGTTTVNIAVVPLTGAGTMNLGITWPSSAVTNPSVVATLTPFGGSTTTLPFSISGSIGTYVTSQSSGYSTLIVGLADNGVLITSAVQVIRIVSGQTTFGSFAFSNINEATGTAQITVTQNLMVPLQVVIGGAPASINIGGNAALTGSVSNYAGPTTYAWYVNGVYTSAGTSLSFGLGRGIGNYRIDLTAFSNDGTQGGSTTTYIQVVTPNGYNGPVGIVTTLASTGFSAPTGAATYMDGNLYIADTSNFVIKKVVIGTGVTSILAGSGSSGSANGIGTAASFANPTGVATDGTNLYVAEKNSNRIRKIVLATGVVTNFAGSGSSGSVDGTGTAATFNGPSGVATDGINLYVAESYGGRIRKIALSTAVVTTLAGSGYGSANGTGTAAGFTSPTSLATDGANLYVADTGNNEIRKIMIASAVVTTLAGSTVAGSANGTGAGAGFTSPAGIATDGINLYVADTGNNEIRKIVIATGAVTTLAGSTTAGTTNGTGGAAKFSGPGGITTDGINVYVADTVNNLIREIQ